MMESTWINGLWVQSLTRDQTAWPPGFSQHGKSNQCQLENSSSIEPHHVFKATSRKFQGNVWTRAFMIRQNGPVGPGVMEYCRAACKSALLAYWMAVKVWPTGSCSQFQVGDLREMSRFLGERLESAERSLMVEQTVWPLLWKNVRKGDSKHGPEEKKRINIQRKLKKAVRRQSIERRETNPIFSLCKLSHARQGSIRWQRTNRIQFFLFPSIHSALCI